MIIVDFGDKLKTAISAEPATQVVSSRSRCGLVNVPSLRLVFAQTYTSGSATVHEQEVFTGYTFAEFKKAVYSGARVFDVSDRENRREQAIVEHSQKTNPSKFEMA